MKITKLFLSKKTLTRFDRATTKEHNFRQLQEADIVDVYRTIFKLSHSHYF